ncbi:MAG: hypothetical protein LC808_35205 [Actinobacteria bacterium]|nr:hypothetical protein [Actinomycetota bacterium]
MADEKDFADPIRDHASAGDSPHAHQPPGRRRWTDVLIHRWPTALGIAVAAMTAYDMDLDEGIEFLSPLMVVMALAYLGAAVLDRRWSAWVLLLAGLAIVVVLRPLDSGVAPSVGLLVAALVLLVLGVARGLLRRPGGLTLQATGMLGFGAIALAALYVDLDLGRYLVAAGLIGHAAWDTVHYRLDRVVARSYAEFCAVLDILVGAAILFMMQSRTAAVHRSLESPRV